MSAATVHRILAPNPGTMTLEGTNTWVIEGPSGAIVIDPGPDDATHVTEILNRFDVVAVLVTHRHDDHIEALESYPPTMPIYAASPNLAKHRPPIGDGDVLELGGVRIEVLGTPGHTEDSVCFVIEVNGETVVFTGDTIIGAQNSTYVSMVGGDLAEVFNSMRRLKQFAGVRGLPGHGYDIEDLAIAAQDAIDFRARRLGELAERLEREPGLDPLAIARERHPDHPDRWRFSAWNISVELEYLRSK